MRTKLGVLLLMAGAVLSLGWRTGSAQFKIIISTQKPVVQLGSDVPIKIQLTNNSHQELNTSANISDLTGVDPNYSYEARDSRGNPVKMKRHEHPELAFGHAIFGSLKPGESVTTVQDISHLLDFDMPGKYVIQVSRRIPDPKNGSLVKSNKIVITVTR